jgi:hypothetical protein
MSLAAQTVNFRCYSEETVELHTMSMPEVEFKTTLSVSDVRIRCPLYNYNASNPCNFIAVCVCAVRCFVNTHCCQSWRHWSRLDCETWSETSRPCVEVSTYRSRLRWSVSSTGFAETNCVSSLKVCSLHGRAMAQAVSRRPLTAEARFRSRASSCGICGGQIGTGTVFPRVLRSSPVNFIPPVLH